MVNEMNLAEGKYIRSRESGSRRCGPWRKVCVEYRFAHGRAACGEILETMKSAEYCDQSRNGQCGRGGFRKGTACSEQTEPQSHPISKHESILSVPLRRSGCVRKPQSS